MPDSRTPASSLPILGRHYRRVYGYSWRWSIWAEVCWRVEHLPWSFDGQVFGPFSRWGYRHRKQAERRGMGWTP